MRGSEFDINDLPNSFDGSDEEVEDYEPEKTED